MIGWIRKARLNEMTARYKPVSVHASLFSRTEGFGVYGSPVVESFPFDLLLNESHTLEFSLSDHAIDDGATITDHVTRKLRSCTIKGFFTNHPMENSRKSTGSVTIADYDSERLEREEKAQTNRALEMLEQLEAIAEKKQPVRLVTAMKIYPEMLIQSISYSREPNSGSAVTFTMKLREFKMATVKIKKYTVNIKTESGQVAATPNQAGLNSAQQVALDTILNATSPW